MNITKTLAVVAIGVMLGAGYTVFGALLNPETLGSVTQGSEYNSTQVTSATASSTATTQVKSYAGSLGSVVVTEKNTVATGFPALVIYDATSTMATATAKVLAKFSTTTGQDLGNYDFNTAFSYGLKIEVPVGFNGVYTVTYR